MTPNRINLKLYLDNPPDLDLAVFIPIFHRWIQQNSVEGLLIDVANYKHVPDGPGVLLIGHEGDYAIDLADGRPGLLYSRKRDWPDTASEPQEALAERLELVFRLALRAAQLLEEEPALAGQVRFRTDVATLIFADRLRTPNRPETVDALQPAVQAFLASLYAGQSVDLTRRHPDDPRRALRLDIGVPDAPPPATLLSRLQPAVQLEPAG